MSADVHDLAELLAAHRGAQTATRVARAALHDAEAHAERIRAAALDRLLRLGIEDPDLLALLGAEVEK